VNILTPYLHRLLTDWQQLALVRWRSEGKKRKNAWCVRARDEGAEHPLFAVRSILPRSPKSATPFREKQTGFFAKCATFTRKLPTFLSIIRSAKRFFSSTRHECTTLDKTAAFGSTKESTSQKQRFHRKTNTTGKK